MGSSLVLLFGLVAAARLADARYLGRRTPTYWGSAAQRPPGAEPERRNSRNFAHQAGSFQTEPSTDPLTWRFPEPPMDPVVAPPVGFEAPRPPVSNRVALRCGENRVQVELKQDLLNIGRPIRPEEITLGGCSPTEVDDWAHVIAFESELHDCGSTLLMTKHSFIYRFTLVYEPMLDHSGITRSQRAVIGVECHYPRRFQNLTTAAATSDEENDKSEATLHSCEGGNSSAASYGDLTAAEPLSSRADESTQENHDKCGLERKEKK